MAGPAGAFAAGWKEPLTLLAMLACFGALVLVARWPIGVSLAAAAWLGAAVNGTYFPLRHLIEGAFSYLDPILVIATAMIFMRVLADGGALAAVGRAVERRFGSQPLLLLPTLMLIVMFPGMITGSSTASVLTTGAMAASILVGMGLPAPRAAALVAMGGILGMVAPPVNIPAMLIGTGIDLPYVGFALPLALVSFPLALVLAYALGWPIVRRTDRGAVVTPRDEDHVAGAAKGQDVRLAVPAWRALVAPVVAALLMLGPRVWPLQLPDPGLPLVFLIAAAAGVLSLARFPLMSSMTAAISESLPVLGILAGVGGFIQVMTLTGGRGWLVALMLGAPPWAIVAAAAVSMPLFGAVSAFGSASVLGVPFLLALLGRNEVVTTAALSLLASLGDLMVPAALAATLAAQVAGVPDRRQVLRLCVLPALLAMATALMVLMLSSALGVLLT
jgi:TRAP-type C4-dicarboxylate transport system permease large subunit